MNIYDRKPKTVKAIQINYEHLDELMELPFAFQLYITLKVRSKFNTPGLHKVVQVMDRQSGKDLTWYDGDYLILPEGDSNHYYFISREEFEDEWEMQAPKEYQLSLCSK